MKLAMRHVGFIAGVALSLASVISPSVWPGGSSDEPENYQDYGPSYFGFVKDTAGKVIPDAQVTAEIKGRGAVLTRGNAIGWYKLPGFGKEVSPSNVAISCSKDGYKQIRVFRRPQSGKTPQIAIQTDCTMQRAGRNR